MNIYTFVYIKSCLWNVWIYFVLFYMDVWVGALIFPCPLYLFYVLEICDKRYHYYKYLKYIERKLIVREFIHDKKHKILTSISNHKTKYVWAIGIIVLFTCVFLLEIKNENLSFLKNPLLLSTMVGALAVTVPCVIHFNNKIKTANINFYVALATVLILIYLLLFSKKILSFFIFYEMFLITSCVILVVTSPNKRSTPTLLYFLFWTQTASFVLLATIIVIIKSLGIYYFFELNLTQINVKSTLFCLISCLLFIAFGVKIPVWPFHFWLTKTHVEATTSFSIFLSGVLVKIAIVGMYKFNIFFSSTNSIFFISMVVMSIVDMAFKIQYQTDLKKIVAMATIIEMNMITLLIFFLSKKALASCAYFIFFHSIISAVFFFIVEIIYKKYGTRVTLSVNSIFVHDPFLAILIILSLSFFLGLPLTLKFFVEINLFVILWSFNKLIFFIVITSMTIFNFFFFKFFIGVLFGYNVSKSITRGPENKNIGLLEISFFILFFLSLLVYPII